MPRDIVASRDAIIAAATMGWWTARWVGKEGEVDGAA
jgi:hypothetical protein